MENRLLADVGVCCIAWGEAVIDPFPLSKPGVRDSLGSWMKGKRGIVGSFTLVRRSMRSCFWGDTGRREGVGAGFCVVRRGGNAARFISANLVCCPERENVGAGTAEPSVFINILEG
jgi:hypothetical protein